jgi:hypothetical protein
MEAFSEGMQGLMPRISAASGETMMEYFENLRGAGGRDLLGRGRLSTQDVGGIFETAASSGAFIGGKNVGDIKSKLDQYTKATVQVMRLLQTTTQSAAQIVGEFTKLGMSAEQIQRALPTALATGRAFGISPQQTTDIMQQGMATYGKVLGPMGGAQAGIQLSALRGVVGVAGANIVGGIAGMGLQNPMTAMMVGGMAMGGGNIQKLMSGQMSPGDMMGMMKAGMSPQGFFMGQKMLSTSPMLAFSTMMSMIPPSVPEPMKFQMLQSMSMASQGRYMTQDEYNALKTFNPLDAQRRVWGGAAYEMMKNTPMGPQGPGGKAIYKWGGHMGDLYRSSKYNYLIRPEEVVSSGIRAWSAGSGWANLTQAGAAAHWGRGEYVQGMAEGLASTVTGWGGLWGRARRWVSGADAERPVTYNDLVSYGMTMARKEFQGMTVSEIQSKMNSLEGIKDPVGKIIRSNSNVAAAIAKYQANQTDGNRQEMESLIRSSVADDGTATRIISEVRQQPNKYGTIAKYATAASIKGANMTVATGNLMGLLESGGMRGAAGSAAQIQNMSAAKLKGLLQKAQANLAARGATEQAGQIQDIIKGAKTSEDIFAQAYAEMAAPEGAAIKSSEQAMTVQGNAVINLTGSGSGGGVVTIVKGPGVSVHDNTKK